MTLLIDPPAWPAHGRLWSHLASDTSFEELHAFAARLGVPERGFEGDHYDLPEDWYARAVAAGAVPVPSRELLARLHAAGLRRPKRRGEVVITSLPLGGGVRVDTLVSARPPRRPASHVVLLAARPDDGLLVALPGGLVPSLPVPPDGDAFLALAATVLGPARPASARQIGLLRYVGADPADVRIDVVLAVDGAGHEPLPPARWADAGAVSAVQPPLAPLISLAIRPPGA